MQFEPCGRDAVRDGAKRAFGRELNATYDFTKADVVLSLDADFLGSGPGARPVLPRLRRPPAGAGQRQDPGQGGQDSTTWNGRSRRRMSRLYAVECMPSTTGGVADHRLPLRASHVESFARELAAELGVAGAPRRRERSRTRPQKWLGPVAADLTKHRGRCVVIAGDHQPASLHALAHAINSHLGNIGQHGVPVSAPASKPGPTARSSTCRRSSADMAAEQGRDALLILGGTNPAYTAPADVKFADAIKNVPFRFHLGSHQDETAALCEWHVNEAHYLEAWGDGRGHDGTVAIQQPLIAPLYAGKSAIELLADVTNAPLHEGREIVRAHWRKWFTAEKQAGRVRGVLAGGRCGPGVVAGSGPAAAAKAPALAGDWATGARRPRRPRPRPASSRSTSAPTRPCSTAGSPTTAGSRNCPGRSPSSPGTTRRSSAPRRPRNSTSRRTSGGPPASGVGPR